MNTEENKHLDGEHILDTIKTQHISMRPKWHFLLSTILAIVGGVCIWLTLIYLMSFIFFILHYSGVWFIPTFGSHGWYVFFLSLPWLLILLLVVFIAMLEILIQRYAFTYRRPLLYSVGGIILIIMVSGSIVSQTSLHGKLLNHAQKNRLPLFARQFYRGFEQQKFKNIHRGIVMEFNHNGFILKNRPGEVLTIVITSRTYFLHNGDLSVGDAVVIFGEREKNIIHALGVREIEDK